MRRARSQSGFAMPVVIGVTSIMMLLVALGITMATRSLTESREDRNVKVARQTADAGLDVAIMRLNQALAGNAAMKPCLDKDAAGNMVFANYAAGGEWCAPVTDTLPDGTTATYRISQAVQVPGTSPPVFVRKVVVTGTARGETRRVYAEVSARQGLSGFGIYGIAAKEDILFQDNVVVGTPANPVDVRTNGNIRMQGPAEICGNVSAGPGKTLQVTHPATICPGMSTTPATTQMQFPDYEAEHEAARVANDNARLGCGGGANKDACTSPGGVQWSSTSRQLSLKDQGSVTLGGNTYSLCRLHLTYGSKLYIGARPAGAPPLKIFIDSPENCPGVPAEQVMVENGTGISNLNSDPATLQIFVRGQTIVNFKNSSSVSAGTPMMLYAPNARVVLENTADFVGGLVGKTVELKNDATFTYDPSGAAPVVNPHLIYKPTQQRECAVRSSPAAAPDAGC